MHNNTHPQTCPPDRHTSHTLTHTDTNIRHTHVHACTHTHLSKEETTYLHQLQIPKGWGRVLAFHRTAHSEVKGHCIGVKGAWTLPDRGPRSSNIHLLWLQHQSGWAHHTSLIEETHLKPDLSYSLTLPLLFQS